ncbi:MAG: Gfo/Idh/MocA family oxidoreductase [Planctomycetes bacterium]|nr:Gfo/Idh/MocA family oxidoreductase [Planctomycetota bacterium]
MFKVGIIGAGNNGKGHARCLSNIEGVKVVGFADAVMDAAQAASDEFGGKPFTKHNDLLGADVDAVWISSPNFMHAEQTIDAAKAGVHVMCEKPMGLTLDECDAMIEAHKAAGTKLMIGQSTRYGGSLKKLLDMLAAGVFGRLIACWSTRLGHYAAPSPGHWRVNPKLSGGVKMEWEIHEIDVLRCIGGKVTSVYGSMGYSREDVPDYDDTFAAILTFEDGAFGRLDASQGARIGFSNRGLMGSKGMAYLHGRNEIRYKTDDTNGMQTIEVPLKEHEKPEAKLAKLDEDTDFVRACQEDREPTITGEDARVNIEIALAILNASEQKQVIPLDANQPLPKMPEV